MPDGATKSQNGRSPASAHAARQLIAELRQPLTAASNYVGTAREIVCARDSSLFSAATDMLEKAGDQILAAAKIAGRLRDCLEIEKSPGDVSAAQQA